jgi:predicted transposase/invertase (TIGR01784 family)
MFVQVPDGGYLMKLAFSYMPRSWYNGNIRERGESVHQPNDKGYKSLFSSKLVFLQFLRSFIKEPWTWKMREEDLIRADKAFVTAGYRGLESDLVYRARITEGDKEVWFYILVEFQSASDRLMPLRIHTYSGELWRDAVKNADISPQSRTFLLPRIVPIVIYNGKARWRAPRRLDELLTASHDLQSYTTDQAYILLDVHRLDQQMLLEQDNLISSVFLLDRIDHVEVIVRQLRALQGTIQRFSEIEYGLFWNWTRRILANKLPHASKQFLLEIADYEEVDRMITNIERVIDKALSEKFRQGKQTGLAEGKKVGLAEGKLAEKREIARKLLKMGLSPQEVADITELPLAEIIGINHSKA